MPLCAPTHVAPVIRTSLRSILESLEADGHERRRARRSKFEYRLLLTPLDGVEPVVDPLYVEGRDLSARGIGFEHVDRLDYRRVRLSAADPVLTDLGFGDLQIDLILKWCRFLSPGVYESGGRVTRTTAPLF